jgi:hypothetical protein
MRLEAIAFRVTPGPLRLPLAWRIVAGVLDERMWTVSPLAIAKGEFKAVPRRRIRTSSARRVSSAWQSVHRLRADRRILWAEPLFEVLKTKKKSAHLVFDVCRDSGTSFACAGTAGVAALWISHHGRQTLVDKYGASGIPAVFKQLLQGHCTVPDGWDTDNYGPGIVNAFDLLTAPLPDAPGISLRPDGRKPASIDDDMLEQIVHLAFPGPRSGVALMMAGVLRVPESMLTSALYGIGNEIVFTVAHDQRLRNSLRASAEAVLLQPDARTARRSRGRWATAIRRRLSGRSASPQLRHALAAGRR